MKHAASTLFPIDNLGLQWEEFPAAGFPGPVSGVVYRTAKPPCCGVPVGGLATGCLDIDARGIYGWSSLFNPVGPNPLHKTQRLPRRVPRVRAVLGLAVQ